MAEDKKEEKKSGPVSYVAKQDFRDRLTKKLYKKGDAIDKADEATTKNRIDRKLIEKA